jgi:two-component system, OmpR family, sensor histidine kinase KdpD
MDASPQAIGNWPNAGRSIRAGLLGVSLQVSSWAGFLITWPRSPGPRRGLSGYALAAALAPLLTLVLALLRAQLTLTTDVLAFLVAVIAVALLGGLGPALLEVVAGLLLLTFYFTPPTQRLTIAAGDSAAALSLFAVLAVVMSLLISKASRRAGQAARPIAEADRIRTTLLAALSHDLRTPLAGAKAAVSGLRSPHVQLTAADHEDLLATADESLDLLTHLVTSLLDMNRLQAGAWPVTRRPADLQEIITRSLDSLGAQARGVITGIPSGLPPVMADPVIMERVIANVTANALRYSPDGSPPLLTACTRRDRIELRVVDHGPGVPETDWDRIFLPFQRLDGTGTTTGVGLGLTVSRSLTEAMRGTLEPEETPGGGLTMAISVPAAPAPSHTSANGPESRRVSACWPLKTSTASRGQPENPRPAP